MSPLIRKSSGHKQEFDDQKFLASLLFSGASEKVAKQVLADIKAKIKHNTSTRKISRMAFERLKHYSKSSAVNYSLKKAIYDLGPEGHLFEKFMSGILAAKGYEVRTGIILKGKCVSHEVDVIGERSDHVIYMECKFHNAPSRKNDVKTALYIYARSLDLRENPKNNFHEFWLASNTSYTQDAIRYADCVGMKLIGINGPHGNSIQELINRYKVHPITCLQKLKVYQKKKLMAHKVVFCRELMDQPSLLDMLDVSAEEKKSILYEVKRMMGRV
jgi:hypothetical protein